MLMTLRVPPYTGIHNANSLTAVPTQTCKPVETRKTLQNKLFHDSPEDALTTDVLASGGYKKVGHKLRPDLTPEQAAAWLRACLNVERQEKLSPGQVLEIKRDAKAIGSTAAIDYDAQELAYRIEHVEPEDEAEQIERENNVMLKEIIRRQERLEQLRTRAQVRAVK